MGFLTNVHGFDWKTFGFLLDAEGAGARDSVLQLFIDFSWEIAFVAGMVAFAVAIYKSISGQNTNILLIFFKLILAIILISNYEPLCETAINSFDGFSSLITKGDYKYNKFAEMGKQMESDKDRLYQAIYGDDDTAREEAKEELKTKKSRDPYRFSLWNFNLLELLGSLILALSQIVIFLISKFRDVTLAFLLLIGRLCIVGIILDITEGLAKGWLLSFLNALSWNIWLSIIVYFQAKIAFDPSVLVNTDPEAMMNGIATLIVFFFLYLQVFGLWKELFSGSFGTAAASIGSMVTAGIAGKVMMEGAKKGVNKLGGLRAPGLTISEKDGLSQMDSSVSPVKINDSLPSLSAPQARQIDGDSYTALPSPPQTDFYGGDDGLASSSNYTMDNLSSYNSNDDGGPIIDAEYTINDD